MEGLVDKIVEKYSDDLLRAFPLQKIFSTILAVLILLMVKRGEYKSALESVLQLSLRDLLKTDGHLVEITLGMLACGLGLIALTSLFQRHVAETITRNLAKRFDLQELSQLLHENSTRIALPSAAISALTSEYSDRLDQRRRNLAWLSSIAELLFMVGSAEVAAAAYGLNTIDFLFAVVSFLVWLAIRGWLVFRFIAEILPLEAHLFGIKGMPYELTFETHGR